MGDQVEKGDRIAQLEHASDPDLSPSKTTDGAHVGGAHVSRIPIPEVLQKYTKEERDHLEVKLKRKIDIRLMPAIIIMYILNYIDRYVCGSWPHSSSYRSLTNLWDRNNIAAARLAGLERDLNLTDVEYQTAVSILFVGYGLPSRNPLATPG